MTYGCKLCVGKLKKDFTKKYNGEFLCRLEGSPVYCNPEKDVVEESRPKGHMGLGIPMIGLLNVVYRCETIDKRFAVPACSFGGHPDLSVLVAAEMENDNLRNGNFEFDKVRETYGDKFLSVLKDLLENDGFEPVKE
jgi:hypothetical protein